MCIRDRNNNKNEVEKKQEEEVNKSHEEVRKVRDNDNAVDFTGVLATKKLATVGSNVSASSKPVSYTHLDVYKRQMYACSTRWILHRWIH